MPHQKPLTLRNSDTLTNLWVETRIRLAMEVERRFGVDFGQAMEANPTISSVIATCKHLHPSLDIKAAIDEAANDLGEELRGGTPGYERMEEFMAKLSAHIPADPSGVRTVVTLADMSNVRPLPMETDFERGAVLGIVSKNIIEGMPASERAIVRRNPAAPTLIREAAAAIAEKSWFQPDQRKTSPAAVRTSIRAVRMAIAYNPGDAKSARDRFKAIVDSAHAATGGTPATSAPKPADGLAGQRPPAPEIEEI